MKMLMMKPREHQNVMESTVDFSAIALWITVT